MASAMDIGLLPHQSGKVMFSGPDGMRHHRRPALDATYTGECGAPWQKSNESSYILRPGPLASFPKTKQDVSGAIGWGIPHLHDYCSPLYTELSSGAQIQRGVFRQAKEEIIVRDPYRPRKTPMLPVLDYKARSHQHFNLMANSCRSMHVKPWQSEAMIRSRSMHTQVVPFKKKPVPEVYKNNGRGKFGGRSWSFLRPV